MITKNIFLFHCLKCGRVTCRESDAEAPLCCEDKMVLAATNTLEVAEASSADTSSGSISMPQHQPNRTTPSRPR